MGGELHKEQESCGLVHRNFDELEPQGRRTRSHPSQRNLKLGRSCRETRTKEANADSMVAMEGTTANKEYATITCYPHHVQE